MINVTFLPGKKVVKMLCTKLSVLGKVLIYTPLGLRTHLQSAGQEFFLDERSQHSLAIFQSTRLTLLA
ncbi:MULTISPECIES: hypothetical protein [unclassified Tolypothrix]